MTDWEAMILDRQEREEIYEDNPDWEDFTEEELELFRKMEEVVDHE